MPATETEQFRSPCAYGFAAVGAESAQGDKEFVASGASSRDVGGEKASAASGAHDKQTVSRDNKAQCERPSGV